MATGLSKKCKVDRFIQDRILNHVDASVGAIYDQHDYLDQKRIAMDKWDAALCELLFGVTRKNNQTSSIIDLLENKEILFLLLTLARNIQPLIFLLGIIPLNKDSRLYLLIRLKSERSILEKCIQDDHTKQYQRCKQDA